MPALFFWALKSIPVEFNTEPIYLFFSGDTHLEFIVCGFIFPLLSIGLGWNAYRRCENKTLSLVVILVGLIEIAAAAIAAISGKGFLSH